MRTPLEETDQKLLAQQLRHDDTLGEVLALPAKYRLPIYLFYYEGYKTKEIADLLAKNEATVRTRLHTGRKLLKLRIEGDGDD